MNDAELSGALRRWFLREELQAPSEDSRRTPNCLPFRELSDLAENRGALSEASQTHARDCAWCQKVLHSFRILATDVPQDPDEEATTGQSTIRMVNPVSLASSISTAAEALPDAAGERLGESLPQSAVPVEAKGTEETL